MRRLLAPLLCAGLLAGCSGTSCDDLGALRAERDAARAAYAELVRAGTADEQETTAADDAVHDLDERVFDLEQQC